jgi:hypothetical protein
MKKALLLCPESFSQTFTGIGKRVLQISSLLKKDYQITLSMKTAPKSSLATGFNFQPLRGQPRQNDLTGFDLVYCNALTFATLPALKTFKGVRLVDLIIPFFLEHQIMFQEKPENVFFARKSVDLALLMDSLRCGDIFLTASPQQTDLYAGLYALTGKSLSDHPMVPIPFYLEPRPRLIPPLPLHLAWIGGFWTWFDPSSLIAVLPRLMQKNPSLRVSFVGCVHPFDLNLHQKDSYKKLKDLEAKYHGRLTLLPWLPYADYLNFLKTVHQAVVLHKDTPEARYSLRTRYFELIEEGIPLLCSAGGCLAPILEKCKAATFLSNPEPDHLLEQLEACLNQALEPKGRFSEIYPLFHKEHLSQKLLERLRMPVPKSDPPSNPYLTLKPTHYYYKRFRIGEAWAKGWRYFFHRVMAALKP